VHNSAQNTQVIYFNPTNALMSWLVPQTFSS